MKGKRFMNNKDKKIITRKNLIKDISEDTKLSRTEVTTVMNSLCHQIKKHILETENVTEIKFMPGIVICGIKHRNKQVTDPRNGQVSIKDYIQIKTRISNHMHKLGNGGNGNGK